MHAHTLRWVRFSLLVLGFGVIVGCSGSESPEGGGSGGAYSMGDGGVTGDGDGDLAATGGITGLRGSGGTEQGEPSGGAGGDVGSGGADSGTGGEAPGSGGAVATERAHCKRGVGYGYHSIADMGAISSGVSWWYNWAFRPDDALSAGQHLALDVEYVPMIWGAGSDREAAGMAITSDVKTLLGFNEPNFGEQSNISAADAAALWPEVEAIADAHGLYLVSPALNFCGGNCQDTDPFNYLDEFLAACTGCRVDALAIHIYVGCNAGGSNHAEWLINHVENYKNRFERPLWLTEFACDDAANADEQQAFMEDAVAYLEGEPRIERYAWFAGRADNVPHVDLLGEDGQLTSLGQAYVTAPQPEECKR